MFAELTRHVAEAMVRANIDLAIEIDSEHSNLAQARAVHDHQGGGNRLTGASFVDDLTVYAKPRAMAPAAIKGTAKRTPETVVRWVYACGVRPRAKNQDHDGIHRRQVPHRG